MISTELLSEVLISQSRGYTKKGIIKVYGMSSIDDASMFQFYYNTKLHSINIHELAHKCKEWAWKTNHVVSSFALKAHWRVLVDSKELFIADTEPESIFKACQWLLDTKNF